MTGSCGAQIEESSDRPAPWNRSISATADRAADGLRRHKYVILIFFSCLYLLATFYRASRKLFWFDELCSVYVSRLPDMASVWSALKHGMDFNPPLFYAVTRLSESLFGEGHIATRLPAILGFWIFCLCLFRFVSCRTSVLAGLISMLFPLVTTAYFYSYEARPHGVVLGLCGIALLCWQAGIHSRRRRGWWFLGLFGALFCAILNHTYAMMLVIPLALAESLRSISLRRFDWTAWLAIACSWSAVLFSIPLWRAARATVPVTFFPAKVSALAKSYQFHLAPAAGVLAAFLFLYFVFKFAAPGRAEAAKRDQSLELFEVVAVIGFVFMPFFTFLLARLTGAPIIERYSISTVAGFACLFGIVAARRAAVGLGVLAILVLQIGINLFEYVHTATIIEPSSSIALDTTPSTLANSYQMMETVTDKNLPIVILDDLESLPIIYYAPPELASRMVYVLPPGRNVAGELIIRGNEFYLGSRPAETMANFLSLHDTFLVQSNVRSLYRLNDFIHQGGDVRIESASTDSFLASVTFKKSHGEAASNTLQ